MQTRRGNRTFGGVLAVCLNAEVEPPDSRCPRHLRAVMSFCGIDLQAMSMHDPRKVVAAVGRELEQRFMHLHGSRACAYRQCLDPTSEQVQRTCLKLRREAGEDNLLLHYSGHGVPAPSTLGELWFFNESYTEYVPARVVDVAQWLGAPRLMIFDTACSEHAVGSLKVHFGAAQQQALECGGPLPIIALGATSAGERLPVSEVFPADVFTACLTKPLEMAMQLSIQRSARHSNSHGLRASEVLSRVPDTLADRRSPLGELNWVLTAITDAIAWQLLPQNLFCRLFRQDVTLSAMLRNFILATRVMWHLQCSVVSQPELPASHAHPLWDQWDHTVDLCLLQLQQASGPPTGLAPPTPFFSEQLTAFKLAIDLAAMQGVDDGARTPESRLYLPVVLQALLSQSHRIRAIHLLRGFVCLGPWAIQQVLDVGIFQYLAKLLNSCVPELRSTLLHVWAILLSYDSSCQVECIKANRQVYFAAFLRPPAAASTPGGGATATREEHVLALLVYGVLCSAYAPAQHQCLKMGLAGYCKAALESPDALACRWALFCLTQFVWANRETTLAVLADTALLDLALGLLRDDGVVEVRAAAVAFAGALLGTASPGGLAGAALTQAPELLRRYGEVHNAATSAWLGSAACPQPNGHHAAHLEPRFERILQRVRDAFLAAVADASPAVRAQLALFMSKQLLGLPAQPQRIVQHCLRLMDHTVDPIGAAADSPPPLELTLASLLRRDVFPLVRERMARLMPPVDDDREPPAAVAAGCSAATKFDWGTVRPPPSRGNHTRGAPRRPSVGGSGFGRHELNDPPSGGARHERTAADVTRPVLIRTALRHAHKVAMHPSAPLVVATCGDDHLVCAWDFATAKRANCFASPAGRVSGLEILDCSRPQLLLGHQGGVVHQWSDFGCAGRQKLVCAWNALPEGHEQGGGPFLMRAHHTQQLLLTAGGGRSGAASKLRLWDLNRSMCVWSSSAAAADDARPRKVATSLFLDPSGGDLLGAGRLDGSLALYDRRASSQAADLAIRMEDGVALSQVFMLPCGGSGRVVGAHGSTVRFADTRTGKVFLELASGRGATAFACDEARNTMSLGLGSSRVELHDLSSWSRATLRVPNDAASSGAAAPATCMAFHPTESLVAVGAANDHLAVLPYGDVEFQRVGRGVWGCVDLT